MVATIWTPVLFRAGFFLGDTMAPHKAAFFIDGFNVYHALKGDPDGRKDIVNRPILSYSQYYWLNYHQLAEHLKLEHHEISKVFYFTAYYHWREDRVRDHKTYVRALESVGVIPVFGKYKQSTQYCSLCRQYGPGRREKQTDVNIAVTMIEEGLKDTYDSAYLMTADTDYVPALRAMKRILPHKQLGVVFPIGRHSNELKRECHFHRATSEAHLAGSQFPNPVFLPSGKELHKPDNWD